MFYGDHMENTENAAPPTSPRTAAATAARKRQREEAAATLLVERGWTVITPGGLEWVSKKPVELWDKTS